MAQNAIRFELPLAKDPFKVSKIFDKNIFENIKKQVLEIGLGPDSHHPYHTTLGRWESGIQFDEKTESEILKRAREVYGNDDIEKAYYFISRYQKINGNIPNLWEHMDQYACQMTIDLCVDKNNLDWGLLVNGQLFEEEENSAICFFGQQQAHGRPEYPTDNEESYITLLFLHFVTKDHWFYTSKTEEERMSNFKKYALDGDIRYFYQTGNISKPNLPENQKMCDCHKSYNTDEVVLKRVRDAENAK
jgi:hypothetical protein